MPPLVHPWLVYFAVDDCDSAFEKGRSTGASAIVPPMDIPPGWFAILKYLKSVEFAVIKTNPEFSMDS
jgi:predicted enzyme related to lactoylglutathione lyase